MKKPISTAAIALLALAVSGRAQEPRAQSAPGDGGNGALLRREGPKGVYESFFKYFGEEGVAFNPHPHRFREEARRNPPPEPPPPREFKLEWWPVCGDVAESGDLGYKPDQRS
ncbi:MAG: hypothetical protein ACRD3V_04620 [Vicinamibacteria bacterium]